MMIGFDEEIKSGIDGEWIANCVYVGDNIVVIADNETNEQFWLMDKVVHNVEESFENQWGNSYVEGDTNTRGYMQGVVLTFTTTKVSMYAK